MYTKWKYIDMSLEMLLTIAGFAFTGLGGICTYFMKRLNEMDKRLRDAPSRKEVTEEIELRLEPIKVRLDNLKEDTSEIKESLKKLADKK